MKSEQCSQIRFASALLLPLLLGSCGGLGKVNQGRVIAFDREKGLVTCVSDSNYKQPGHPRYDVLPPVTVKIPSNPKQMGPVPDAGMLMDLDTAKRSLVIFDPATQSLKSIEYTLVAEATNVFRNDPRISNTAFPVVDRQKKTISIYLRVTRQLLTFSVPDQYFQLPDETWKAGDEIRYYYKDPTQAVRLMNITKTDIS